MSVHSLTTAPVNVYSKTFWTGFILAVSEEAAYELGHEKKMNPAAVQDVTERGWSAERLTPNILLHTESYSFLRDLNFVVLKRLRA